MTNEHEVHRSSAGLDGPGRLCGATREGNVAPIELPTRGFSILVLPALAT